MEVPTIGRIVVYRSRTGNYSVPAIVTATEQTLAAVGVEMYRESGGQRGVPPLSSPSHVHLAVLTPGKPGLRVNAQDFLTEESPHGRAENVGGLYQEWDIAWDEALGAIGAQGNPSNPYEEQLPGTWAWPR